MIMFLTCTAEHGLYTRLETTRQEAMTIDRKIIVLPMEEQEDASNRVFLIIVKG